MTVGSINILDDEKIESKMKTKSQLFARQNSQPSPSEQSVYAGEALLSNSAPNIPSYANGIMFSASHL